MDPTDLTPTDLAPFEPSQTQALAKSRLHQRLAERRGLLDLESLTLDQVVALAGDARVERWLRDPAFAAWLYDRDTFVHRAVALKDLALRVLEDTLLAEYEPKVLTAKDKLKAADMLLQLTGAYPKAAPARFLDRDLDQMDADEVERQLAAAKAALPKGAPQ